MGFFDTFPTSDNGYAPCRLLLNRTRILSVWCQRPEDEISMLLIGNETVEHRCLNTREFKDSTRWFTLMELQAWESFRQDRPEEIFLVLGETLASHFAIRHVKTSALANGPPECNLRYEDIPPPESDQGSEPFNFKLLDNPVKLTSPSIQRHEDSENPYHYPIVLEVKRSKPMKIIPQTHKAEFKKFLDQFKYGE